MSVTLCAYGTAIDNDLYACVMTGQSEVTIVQDCTDLSECVKDEAEVPDGSYCGKALLIHVTGLLNEAPPDVVVGQTGPKPSNLQPSDRQVALPVDIPSCW